MRHRKNRLRLKQKPAHGRGMERNLVTSLLLYEGIRTTKKRALVIRPIIDRLITTAKTKSAHNAIRAINRVVTHRNASRKIMEVFVKRYASRSSGLTRMVPVGSRRGDGAALVDLILVGAESGTATVPKAPTEPKVPKSKKKITSVPSVPSETSAPSAS